MTPFPLYKIYLPYYNNVKKKVTFCNTGKIVCIKALWFGLHLRGLGSYLLLKNANTHHIVELYIGGNGWDNTPESPEVVNDHDEELSLQIELHHLWLHIFRRHTTRRQVCVEKLSLYSRRKLSWKSRISTKKNDTLGENVQEEMHLETLKSWLQTICRTILHKFNQKLGLYDKIYRTLKQKMVSLFVCW